MTTLTSGTFWALVNKTVGELNSRVAKWLNKGLKDNSHLRHFVGVRKQHGGRIEFLRGKMAP